MNKYKIATYILSALFIIAVAVAIGAYVDLNECFNTLYNLEIDLP